ncbi:hypothetical protein [Enterobacter sp.]|uniref:hypothetical protein n=1 Tax=Enterobacter sp. TaxID=42895 RepID=UPI00296F4CE8|nr:hypothetical protein [Enterobacter sp.]
MAKVDIVQVNNGDKWEPETHYAVEEEKTAKLLHECDTQKKAIDWAKNHDHEVMNIHRVRNRKPGDQHGRFRAQ